MGRQRYLSSRSSGSNSIVQFEGGEEDQPPKTPERGRNASWSKRREKSEMKKMKIEYFNKSSNKKRFVSKSPRQSNRLPFSVAPEERKEPAGQKQRSMKQELYNLVAPLFTKKKQKAEEQRPN